MKLFQKIIEKLNYKPNLTQSGQFFKKVTGQYTKNQNANNPHIIDKITELNRIIVEGDQKDFLMFRIRQIVTEAQLGHNISPKVQDACEVVHYSLINNIPVLVSKVKLIHPEFDLSQQKIINEKEFEQQKEEQNPELKEEIEIGSDANKEQEDYYSNQRHKWNNSKNRKR